MKKRIIIGHIDLELFDRDNFGYVYFGSLDEVPANVNVLFIKKFIGVADVKAGYKLHYVTTDKGQYEIFAYPKCFGRLTSIDQNNVGINALEGWLSKEIIVYDEDADEDREYYMYYTDSKQYDDYSNFTFKI